MNNELDDSNDNDNNNDELESFFASLYDRPSPSLCDTCIHANHLSGGSVTLGLMGLSVSSKTYRQRYCSALHIGIHDSGKQLCDKYIKKETSA